MHGGGDEVEGVANADDIGVGHIGPQHGVLDVLNHLGLGFLVDLGGRGPPTERVLSHGANGHQQGQ